VKPRRSDTSPGSAELIGRLLADAAPVRPLWSPGVRLALWVLLDAGIIGVIVAVSPRPDIAQQLLRPAFLLQLGTLLAASAAFAMLALRGAIPGSEAGPAERSAALLFVVAAFGLLLQEPVQSQSLATFVTTGAVCFVGTLLLGVLPWTALFLAVRRGAPLLGARIGARAGAAASLFAAGASRLSCPLEDRLHVMVWHGLPVAVAILLSALAGAAWLEAWRMRPAPGRTVSLRSLA
jgi:hypothetical protein